MLALAPRARLWLTAQTRTGRGRLAELGLPVSLAPIDSPQAVARFFAGVAPRLVPDRRDRAVAALAAARAGSSASRS
jgi:hypothetical protein